MSPLSAADLTQSLRRLRKRPLLTVTVIFALAVGIALATLGFALFEAVTLAELPFDDGERYVRFQVFGKDGSRGLDAELYRLLARDEGKLFDHVGASGGDRFNVRYESGEVESVVGSFLTPSSFARLPYVPVLGRTLSARDGAPGARPVVVLRESLWQRRFDSNPDVVGRALEVAGTQHTVVGVLPDAAAFPADGELWLPLEEAAPAKEGVRGFAILAPGTSLEEAQARVDVAIAQVESQRAGGDREMRGVVRPYAAPPPGATPMVSVLVAVLVLVLLVVAGNIANLMLAQTSARAGELAVRSALGASRARLVAEIFLDVMLMGGVAAILGLGAASRALSQLGDLLGDQPFLTDVTVGPGTMAFVAAVTVLASAVAGVPPALRATRRQAAGSLRSGLGVGFGFGRAGAVLTVVEMALSVGLLSGALVMADGLASHGESMRSLPDRQILTARLVVPAAASPAADDVAVADAVARAAARIPGVLASGSGTRVPGSDAPLHAVTVDPEARGSGGGSQEPLQVPLVEARSGYFEALGTSASSGRLFRDDDFHFDTTGAHGSGPAVAIVNQPFVDRHFRGRSPLGRHLRWSASGRGEDEVTLRIVGVVPDLGLSASRPEMAAGVYVPMAAAEHRWFYLALRTGGEPARFEQPLRRALLEVDPQIQLRAVEPLYRVGWDERAFFAGVGSALLAMGGMAMLLSLVGLFATASLTLSKRRREIGIRVALGAGARQVVGVVLGASLRHVAAGATLGGVLALFLLRVKDRLFVTRLPDGEPWMLAAVIAAFALTATAACWSPAHRALDVPPSEALRSD